MKTIKWFFRFSGLGQAERIFKIIVNLLILALVAGLLYLVYSGFMNAWHWIAKNEPKTKEKFAMVYQGYLKKDDSLSTAKKQINQLAYEYNVCDSSLYASDQKILSQDEQIKQHQKNNLELKKQLETYRRDNKVCYTYVKVGKFLNKEWQWVEVPCSTIKIEE